MSGATLPLEPADSHYARRPETPRILHVVENLHRGAVENWLVRMLGHARQRGVDVDWTFYCALGSHGGLDDTARAFGARVIHSPVPIGDTVAFIRALRAELQHGDYDVVHCHHDLVSAVYLLAASGTNVKRRIVHIHNADEGIPTPSRFKQLLLREPMRRVCLALADRIVGISNHTLDTFLAGRPRRAGKDVVLYYGVDPAPFERARDDRVGFRRGLGVADDAPIILFAGRMVPEKNPLFAVDVFAEMHRLDPRIAGLFVGSGSLDGAIRERATELGVIGAFRALGWRDDLPDIMRCCDWFILPRLEEPREGFGLAIVEAQLAGLLLLISQAILPDPLLPTARFTRLPLNAGARAWALAAVAMQRDPAPSAADAWNALGRSPFDMDVALDHLLALYR